MIFRAVANIRAAAAGKKPVRLAIVAYTGGVMRVPNFGPCAIDLANLEFPPRVALNVDHGESVTAIAGAGKPTTDGRVLTIAGTLTDTDAGQLVAGLLADGIPLAASVEVEPAVTQYVRAGETVAVNGQQLTATGEGFLLVVKGTLRAVSIVASGADKNSSARLAASAHRRGATMDFHEWLKAQGFDPANLEDRQRDTLLKAFQSEQRLQGGADPVAVLQAQRDRRETLRGDIDRTINAGGGDVELLRAMGAVATAEDWTPERWRLEAYRARMSGPIASNRIPAGRGLPPGASPRDVLAAATLLRCGRADIAVKAYGDQVANAAQDLRARTLLDLCAATIRLAGGDVPHSVDDTIRGALRPAIMASGISMVSLPVALGDSVNRSIAAMLAQTPATWRSWCARKPVNDFKQHKSLRAYLQNGRYAKLPPGGEIKHAVVGEDVFTHQADTFARMYALDRRDIINDDAGVLQELPAELARQSARTISDLVYQGVLDGIGGFFADSSYMSGAGTPLGTDSLAAAIRLFRARTDGDGMPIDVTPAVLAVSPALEVIARQLLNSAIMARDTSGADNLPQGNAFQGMLTLEVEARLENETFHANASEDHWLLFAAPTACPAGIVSFLNGGENPTVEAFELGESRLGAGFRAFHDFGFNLADARGGVYVKGKA
jgi:hypothetical protein